MAPNAAVQEDQAKGTVPIRLAFGQTPLNLAIARKATPAAIPGKVTTILSSAVATPTHSRPTLYLAT